MTTIALRPPPVDELVDRYGAPDDFADAGEVANIDRVAWADVAVRAFVHLTNQDWDGEEDQHHEVIGDLVCDLMHLVTALGGDPDEVLDAGRRHFVAEVGLGYDLESPPCSIHTVARRRTQANPLWDEDLIQFARLLSEIAAGQSSIRFEDLCASMDLEVDDINELFDRANEVWENAKEAR